MSERDVKLNHTRFKETEFVRTIWCATVPSDVTRKDLLKPEFWSHIAGEVKSGDLIDVRIDDESFFAQYYVKACTRTYVQVFELHWFDLSNAETEKLEKDMEEYEYKYRGPYAKHSILRKSDSSVMIDKLDTKDAAIKWLFEFKQNA